MFILSTEMRQKLVAGGVISPMTEEQWGMVLEVLVIEGHVSPLDEVSGTPVPRYQVLDRSFAKNSDELGLLLDSSDMALTVERVRELVG